MFGEDPRKENRKYIVEKFSPNSKKQGLSNFHYINSANWTIESEEERAALKKTRYLAIGSETSTITRKNWWIAIWLSCVGSFWADDKNS